MEILYNSMRANEEKLSACTYLLAFRVSAWPARLDSIPLMVNLIIPEPAPVYAELLIVRCGLLYKVQVSLRSSQDSMDDPHSPMPRIPEQEWRCHHSHRHHCSPSPRPPYLSDAAEPAAPTGRTSVNSRLGQGGMHAPPDAPIAVVDVVTEGSGDFPS
jgi:hypothetical protein